MAAVEVTISGMLYDRLNRTTQNVVLIGEASLTGLGVGGGPMPPGPGGGPPVGGPPGQPIHPIWGPPGFNPPGPGMPPGIWGGPILPPPTEPPNPPTEGKPPPADGGWGWWPPYGWGYFPGSGGATPKPAP